VVSVPPSTYIAASEEKLVFDLLNAERSRCGFGLLAQNTAADTAARGHADWLLMNNFLGHFQTAGTPGFTGISAQDRLIAAGYAANAAAMFPELGEVQFNSGGAKAGFGSFGLRHLFNAPYHLAGMLRGNRDVGVALRTGSDIGLPLITRNVLNIDLATLKSQSQQSFAGVRTYPCEGSSGIGKELRNETPNPVPGRNLGANPLGSSVAIVGTIGSTMTITSASMTAPGGVAVVLRPALNSVNDPNKVGGLSYFPVNEAIISADAPLLANTTYQVIVTGTDGTTPFSRSFSFTTGL
jgi:hypothetical protein